VPFSSLTAIFRSGAMSFEMPCSTGSCGNARAVGPVDPKAIRAAEVADEAKKSNGIARHVGPLKPREPLDVGDVPVDGERVGEIRKAIKNGTYPLLPTLVADAIIAAGIMLRTGE
jgi:negative regulator of flagellin synthesis FlgM